MGGGGGGLGVRGSCGTQSLLGSCGGTEGELCPLC